MKTIKKCQCSIGTSVLFQDKKYSIETYLNMVNQIRIVVVVNGIYTDWPIKYSNGDIGYDNPYKIAPYVRKKVAKYYQFY